VLLADTYQWTPQQVDALDPDFVTELIAKLNAKAQHQQTQQKRREEEAKRRKRKHHR
jgi:hypothetical protein